MSSRSLKTKCKTKLYVKGKVTHYIFALWHYASAVCYGPVSIFPSPAGILLKRLNELIWFSAERLFMAYPTLSLTEFCISKMGYFLWNLVPNSELSRCFCFLATARQPLSVVNLVQLVIKFSTHLQPTFTAHWP